MKNWKLIFSLIVFFVAAGSIGFYVSSDNNNPTTLDIMSTPPSISPINVIEGSYPDLIGSWTAGPVVPTSTYFGSGVGYNRNDSGWVYILGGNGSGSGINNVQVLNVRANTYSAAAPLPQALRLMGSAVLKDSVYSFGGVTSASAYVNACYRYSITSNTWTPIANLPFNGGFLKAVGYQDSLIYLAGGVNGGATVNNAVYVYNAINNTWRTCTPLPGQRFGGAFSRSGDTLVYIGGADLSVFYSTTYVGVISQSDRSVITWTTGAAFPPGVMYRMDAHNWGCKGIIVTGGSATAAFTSTSNVCYTYSPGSNTYTAQPNKTTAWTCGQSGSVFQGNVWKLVCASGYNGTINITGTEIFTDTLCPLVGISQIGSEIPSKYSLLQNYPNPFNPTTNISFGLPTAGLVKLVVYDITGRVVETLVNEFKGAGSYNVDFNASSLSSGIYFYSLESEGFKDTKRMVLVK